MTTINRLSKPSNIVKGRDAKNSMKSGYTHEYLPFGDYRNYTMLLSIATFSDNEACSGSAKFFLDEDITSSEKHARVGGEGSFMHEVCKGTFDMAYKRADQGNREALILGLIHNIIEM